MHVSTTYILGCLAARLLQNTDNWLVKVNMYIWVILLNLYRNLDLIVMKFSAYNKVSCQYARQQCPHNRKGYKISYKHDYDMPILF